MRTVSTSPPDGHVAPSPRPSHEVARRTTLIAAGAFLAFALTVVGLRTADLGSASSRAPTSASPKIAVMVHGYQGLLPWSRGYRCSDGILAYEQAGPPEGRSPREAGEFGRLAARLAQSGYDVYFARWTTGGGTTIALKDAAACLAAQVAQARERTAKRTGKAAPPVTLIAHSMGGLVGRAYLEGAASPADAGVATLATFGTPHLGVSTDVLVQLLALLNPGALIRGGIGCNVNPGTCELSRESVAAFNKAHKPRPGASYHAVAGDKGVMPMSWFIAGSDDGVVETRSAAGLDVPRWLVNDAHAAVTPLTTDYYAVSDDSVRCLEGILALGIASRGACQPITRPVGTLTEPGSAGDGSGGGDIDASTAPGPPVDSTAPGLSMSPVTTMRLAPRAVRTVQIVVDGSTADIAIGWSAAVGTTGAAESIDGTGGESVESEAVDGAGVEPVGPGAVDPAESGAIAAPDRASRTRASLDVRLQLPGDDPIEPADIAAILPGSQRVDFDRGALAGAVVYRVIRPPSGPWTVVLRNTGGVAADVGVFAVMASPIRLVAGVGRADGDGRAPLLARLEGGAGGVDGDAGGIGGARVEATVYGSGDATSTAVLEDLGDGLYSGHVDAGAKTTASGLRHVAVRAFGMTPPGVVFARETGIVVVAEVDE